MYCVRCVLENKSGMSLVKKFLRHPEISTIRASERARALFLSLRAFHIEKNWRCSAKAPANTNRFDSINCFGFLKNRGCVFFF